MKIYLFIIIQKKPKKPKTPKKPKKQRKNPVEKPS